MDNRIDRIRPTRHRCHQVVIGAERWRLTSKLAELWQYRELFYFFVWRDVKVRYAQSVLGVGWAIVQPLVPMILFTDRLRQGRQDQLGRRSLCVVQPIPPWCRGPISRMP